MFLENTFNDNFLMLNHRLNYIIGLEAATILCYIIDQYEFHKKNNTLREDGRFYLTNSDISLYTTISKHKTEKALKLLRDNNLVDVVRNVWKRISCYKINFDEIEKLIENDKNKRELAFEKVGIEHEKVYSKEELINLSIRKLQMYCKKYKIEYSGNDRKNTLINKILSFINKNIEIEITVKKRNNIFGNTENLKENLNYENRIHEDEEFLTEEELNYMYSYNDYEIEQTETHNQIENENNKITLPNAHFIAVVEKIDTNLYLSIRDKVKKEKYISIIYKIYDKLFKNYKKNNKEIEYINDS